MAYSRRTVTDGVTIMNKDLYDNLQDGIDECKEAEGGLKFFVDSDGVLNITYDDENGEN